MNVAHFDTRMGDANRDCDLDLGDFAEFQLCFGENPVSVECAVFDFDASDSIDLTDYGSFEDAFTGAI